MPLNDINQEHWALITGATGGLGLEFCKLLAARGYRLIVTGRNTEKLAQIREEIKQVEMALAGDLTDPVCLANLIKTLNENGIKLEVLINNAGFGLFGDTLDQDTSENINLIDLNIRTLTALTLAIAKEMKARGSGYILNVASIAAFMPCPHLDVYAASKSYVLSFSEALHEELKTNGVHVSVLCPGPVKTGFWQRAGVADNNHFEFVFTPARAVAQCGLQAMFTNKTVVTYGWINKILVLTAQIAPRFLVRVISKKVLQSLKN